MKTKLLLSLLAILILFSCKKASSDSTNNTTNNNTNNNSTNNTDPPARSGLELKADSNAVNYIVFVIGSDTMVWQDTHNDYLGGITDTFRIDGVTYIWAAVGAEPNVRHRYKHFDITFLKPTHTKHAYNDCSMVDSVFTPNCKFTIAEHDVAVSVKDSTNLVSNTYQPFNHPTIDIISVTKIAQTNGCYKFRVRGKLHDVEFLNYQCFIPLYTMPDAVFQLDFSAR